MMKLNFKKSVTTSATSQFVVLSTILTSALFYSGCSENRHVTAADAGKADSAGPSQAAAAVPAPSVQVTTDTDTDGSVDTGNGTNTVTINTPPSNGLDGCTQIPRSMNVGIAIESSSPAFNEFLSPTTQNLPYLASARGTPKRLDLLSLGASNYANVNGRALHITPHMSLPAGQLISSRFVKNAQIVFSVRMQLPPRDLVNSISAEMNLQIDRNVDFSPDTEMFCSVNPGQRMCSGKLFDRRHYPEWFALLNPQFGSFEGANSVLRNESFNDLVERHSTSVGRSRVGTPTLNFNLAQIFGHGTTDLSQSELLDLLYSGVSTADRAVTDHLVESTLNFVVLDDTGVVAVTAPVRIDFDCRTMENRRSQSAATAVTPTPTPAPTPEPAPAATPEAAPTPAPAPASETPEAATPSTPSTPSAQ